MREPRAIIDHTRQPATFGIRRVRQRHHARATLLTGRAMRFASYRHFGH